MAPQLIRFDSHTGPALVCAPALERMRACLNGNAPSPELGLKTLYELAGADASSSFVFTSSAAEAINQVHWSLFLALARKEGKCHFVTCIAEEAPLLQSLRRLEELGCFVKTVPLLPSGQIDLAALREALSPRTALLSLSTAHSLTGVVQPIEEIAALAQEKGVLLHLDATHSLGRWRSRFGELPIDYLTFGGDRLHAPAATGGLFAKKGRPLLPLIIGSAEPASLRGGPFDLPSFTGLATAAAQALLTLDTMSLEGARLRDLLEERLLAEIPGARVWFADQLRLPQTTLLSFPGIHQEALLYALWRKQVIASIGGGETPSLHRHLMACGADERTASTALSFSLSRFTAQTEVERGATAIVEAVQALRPLAQELIV